jgi:hypothetical protein
MNAWDSELTADFDGCFKFEEDWLIYKDLTSSSAEILDFKLLQLHRLSRSIPTNFAKESRKKLAMTLFVYVCRWRDQQ